MLFLSETDEFIQALANYTNTDEPVCEWKYNLDGDYYGVSMWDTGCGNSFFFELGTPTENKFVFCPYCGKQLKVVE